MNPSQPPIPPGAWSGPVPLAASVTVDAALRSAAARLAAASELGASGHDAAANRASAPFDPWREARHLAALALGRSHSALIAHGEDPLDAAQLAALDALVARRARGEPLAYLRGRREFWSLDLEVGPAVLVPRPETELLVERALEIGTAIESQRSGNPPLRLADLGTGSGAIALAIASERPFWDVMATDVSAAALEVARRNAVRLGLERVEFRAGRWFEPLGAERFDLIVSNPPYLDDADPALRGDGLHWEPPGALSAGPDALAALRDIIAGAGARLRAGGALLVEHGARQATAVAALLVEAGFAHVGSRADLAGHPRITEARWGAP